MNNFKEKNPQIENYLRRVLAQYQEGKLTYHEEIQFFQDLLDSGIYLELGEDIIEMTHHLIDEEIIYSPFFHQILNPERNDFDGYEN